MSGNISLYCCVAAGSSTEAETVCAATVVSATMTTWPSMKPTKMAGWDSLNRLLTYRHPQRIGETETAFSTQVLAPTQFRRKQIGHRVPPLYLLWLSQNSQWHCKPCSPWLPEEHCCHGSHCWTLKKKLARRCQDCKGVSMCWTIRSTHNERKEDGRDRPGKPFKKSSRWLLFLSRLDSNVYGLSLAPWLALSLYDW